MKLVDVAAPVFEAARKCYVLNPIFRAPSEYERLATDPTFEDVRKLLAEARKFDAEAIAIDDPDAAEVVFAIREDCVRVLRFFGEPLTSEPIPEGSK